MNDTLKLVRFPEQKERYAFVFSDAFQADYWLMSAHLKLYPQVIYRDRRRRILEFEDSKFYFKSASEFDKIRGMHFDYIYSGDAIYIILDDPERLRIKEDN